MLIPESSWPNVTEGTDDVDGDEDEDRCDVERAASQGLDSTGVGGGSEPSSDGCLVMGWWYDTEAGVADDVWYTVWDGALMACDDAGGRMLKGRV